MAKPLLSTRSYGSLAGLLIGLNAPNATAEDLGERVARLYLEPDAEVSDRRRAEMDARSDAGRPNIAQGDLYEDISVDTQIAPQFAIRF